MPAPTTRYLDIQDCSGTGVVWRAPTNTGYGNVNSGNNTGWNFNVLVQDFTMFLAYPLFIQDDIRLHIPKVKYTDIKDATVTGSPLIALFTDGNVDSGNNTNINFTA
jgi:hypothetical protein